MFLSLKREREGFIDNLLVRTIFIIEMIWWTGLEPWEFEFSLPGSRTTTFLAHDGGTSVNARLPTPARAGAVACDYRGTLLIRKHPPLRTTTGP